MKKYFLAVAVAVAVFAVSSPASAGVLQQFLVGEWELTYDWYCDSVVDGVTVWSLEPDGTFTSATGGSGEWRQLGRTVKVRYETGSLPVYTGKLTSLTEMSGKMECTDGSGNEGCFVAVKRELASTVIPYPSDSLPPAE